LLLRLLAAGWDCALPAVPAPGAALAFRRWRPDHDLVAGGYGIPEPPPSAPPLRPAALLVPLLAFDRAGHRLGQGAGHYDRTLAELRAAGPLLALGLAFAVQEEPALPAEPHDQRLDWIVTEAGALKV
jgi:5-formyltetrahydrofolate cyclo-ligase